MENIQSTPSWAKKFIIGWGTVIYNDFEWKYAIMRRDFEPNLYCFMGFNGEHNFLFISQDVPKKWRMYVLCHELREYLDLLHIDERCVVSLIAELKEVPDIEMPEYLRWRADCFRDLIRFYTNTGQPDPAFMRRINASLNHLEVRIVVN